MEKKTKVSILITAYNHEKFIKNTVQSVLNQETTFPYQIIVGEDCSSDNTRNILMDLQKKYPDKIVLKLRSQNLGRKNFMDLFNSCQGEYIAMMDGDDYWIDENKLQRQVDFLENNPGYSMCFTAYKKYYDTPEEKHFEVVQSPETKKTYTAEDIIQKNPMATSSVVLRNHLIGELPDWFEKIPIGDWPLWVMYAERGPVGYIDTVTAVYRLHNSSIYSSLDSIKKIKTSLDTRIMMVDHLSPDLQPYCYHAIYKYNQYLINLYRENKNTDEVRRYAKENDRLYKYYQDANLWEALRLKYFKYYNSKIDGLARPLIKFLSTPVKMITQ